MPTNIGGSKILVVDDETTVAETLALILRSRYYEVRVAFSAEEAIEILAVWRPDLVVTDVMLPQMNGIELGCVVKANYPQCQVLLVSGHPGTTELLEIAWQRGNRFEILAKPLHPTVILDMVAGLLPGVAGDIDA